MSKYRIVKTNGVFDVQRKQFLFGWCSVVPAFYPRVFHTLEQAEGYIYRMANREKDAVVKEYEFKD